MSHEVSGTEYHYSREERLKHRSSVERTDHEMKRRRVTRRLLIVVLDILLVMVVYLVYVFFLQPDASSAMLGGVRLDAQSEFFDDSLLVRVSAVRTEAGRQAQLLEVRVYDAESGSLLVQDLDTLNRDEGAERRMHLRLEAADWEARPTALRIEAELDGVDETAELRTQTGDF